MAQLFCVQEKDNNNKSHNMKISFILSNKINRYTLFYLFCFILIYIWYYRLECGIFTYFFQINQRCVHDLFNQYNGRFYNSIYRRGRGQVWHNCFKQGQICAQSAWFFCPPLKFSTPGAQHTRCGGGGLPPLSLHYTIYIVDFCHL